MSMFQLAWGNVKSSFKHYISLVLSLSFTILIFLNFQNLVYSEAFAVMGEHNKSYSDMLVQTVSAVLGVFMVFFTGYATNVFLNRRKKEIGIYVFMGLTNQKIGKLYMIEMAMVGIVTVAVGIGFGILTTKLFQMIVLSMSEITVDIGFHVHIKPVLITAAFYLAVYLFFACRGYISIVRSSVLKLVSASRQNEYVRQPIVILMLKAAAGIGILAAGYWLAVKKGGQEVLENALLAVILVIIGIYFLFGGFLPMIFQGLARNKAFLYRNERNLWVNQLVFRMKKNYRSYAMVCILMLCSVTALAASLALRGRYENIVHFRNTYTYQLLSSRSDLDQDARRLIEQENELAYGTSISLLMIQDQEEDGAAQREQPDKQFVLLSWTQVKQLAKEAGLAFELDQLQDTEIIEAEHLYLLSLITEKSGFSVRILGKDYRQAAAVNEPYLGYLQESMSLYIVNEAEYDRLRPLGQELYAYNYKIKDADNYKASIKALDQLVSSAEDEYTARIVTGADDVGKDVAWIKVLYSLGVFMFMVFIMAGGSILFMKLYNDAFEDQERYAVLQKLGCSYPTLKHAIGRELLAAYALPFAVMAVSSYFSVHALENMMYVSLAGVRLVSLGVIFLFFLFCYWISVRIYLINTNIRRM